MDRLEVLEVVKKFIGSTPEEHDCDNWLSLQRKMIDELEAVIDKKEIPDDGKYYIQCGYVGNAMLWWCEESSGYSVNIKEAGRYTRTKALNIVNNRPKEDVAWLCSHVDNNTNARVDVIDGGGLDVEFRMVGV